MMRGRVRRALTVLAVMGLPLSSACGSATSPVASSPATTTDTFTATVAQLGSATYAFSVAATGPVSVKLTAVDPLATMSLGVAITVGGGACGSDIQQNTNAKAGAVALAGTATAGSYCLRVFDSGNIPTDTTVTYTAEVTHP